MSAPPTQVFVHTRQPYSRFLLMQKHMENELRTLDPSRKAKKKEIRKGIFERMQPKKKTGKETKKPTESTGFWSYFSFITFPRVMIVLLALFVLLLVYLQLESKTFSTQETFEKIDYYELLEIPDRTIPAKRITSFYRQAVKKWHPDRNPDCGDPCVKKMAMINEAHAVLLNKETRAFHDRYGVRPPESMLKTAKAKGGGRF